MSKNRMEAFSDGVLAIIITIMILKINVPKDVSINGLIKILPVLLIYILSYVHVGIYWMNHHHLVSALKTTSGGVLWRNLHWLFWLSLIPLGTEWVGLYPSEVVPAASYGFILLMCSISYHMLQNKIIKIEGKNSLLAQSIGNDWKGKLSMGGYFIAFIISMFLPIASYLIYIIAAILWLIPNKKLEQVTEK